MIRRELTGFVVTALMVLALAGCMSPPPVSASNPFELDRWRQLNDHELSAVIPLEVISSDIRYAVEIFKSDRRQDLRRRALNALPTEDVVRLLSGPVTPEGAGWILDVLVRRRAPVDASLRTAIGRASDASKREILETGAGQPSPSERLILDDLSLRLLVLLVTEEAGSAVRYRASVLAEGTSTSREFTLDNRGTKIVRMLAPRNTDSLRVTVLRRGTLVFDKQLDAKNSWKIDFHQADSVVVNVTPL